MFMIAHFYKMAYNFFCVANIAVDLAKRYNGDIFKAYVGGLLHDCAKEIPNSEKIRMCDYYGIEDDDTIISNIPVPGG